MIVEIKIQYSDKEKLPQREVDYIRSIETLYEYEYIDGIRIPENTNPVFSNYDCQILIDHIRTESDEKISTAAIYLIEAPEQPLENALEKESLEKVYNNIAVKPRQLSGSRHDQANKWGVYRLLSFLNYWEDISNDVKQSKIDLCNLDLFFKKKINEEIVDKNVLIYKDNYAEVNNLLGRIKDKAERVALVDDMGEHGWSRTFDLVFGPNKVKTFKSSDEFQLGIDKWNQYSMILLDLRLDETEMANESDQLSGNKLLRDIKNHDPEVPIVIITASNKYNNLRDSINYGANDYWVKESYELGLSSEYNYENSRKLINSINRCLDWNDKRRPIIVKLKKINTKINAITIEKKRSLVIALLHNSFSQFINTKLGKAVLDNIYVTIFSVFNEITDYYYKQEAADEADGQQDEIILELEYPDEYIELGLIENNNFRMYDNIAQELSIKPSKSADFVKRLYLILKACENKNINYNDQLHRFKELNGLRNNLTIIHSDESANFSDIDNLLNIMLLITSNLSPKGDTDYEIVNDEDE